MNSLPPSDSASAEPVSPPVSPRDVDAAADRIAGRAVATPLLESAALNEIVGGRLLVKAECLQRTGSFKYRGALNRLSQLSNGDRAKGVVAYSSGNHGQAVAAVANELGIQATIVMPADSPRVKMDGVHRYGARIVPYDRASEEREDVAARLMGESGAVLVRPFDDPGIIAGQGTVGREIARQCREADLRPDAVLVPCSGGGLVAGCALALKDTWADVEIYAVEPEGFDDTARSLASGRRQAIEPGHETISDALRVPTPGEITFEINSRLLAGGLAVSDDETRAAMRAAFHHLKLVVEPGGAVALAAALKQRIDCRDRIVVVVCSGGNVDAAVYASILDASILGEGD